MADISEETLKEEIENILKHAKLENTSTKKVIQQLEKNLDTNLSSKKKLIDQLVMDYVNSMASDEEEESDEEPVPKKEKVESESEESQEVDKGSDSDSEERPKRTRGAAKKRGKKGGDGDEKTRKKPAKAKGRGKGSGYTRAYKLSPALADLMGAPEMARHEVVKRVWALVKEKQLHDPNNRQYAICDKALFKVIGTQRFRIFGMMKYLKTHFIDA